MIEPASAAPILYCSSVSPQPSAAGELLIYRHFSRLQRRKVILVNPVERPPGPLRNVVEHVPVARSSKWLWRLRRGPFFAFADRLLAANIERQFAQAVARMKPAAVLSVFMPDVYLTAAAAFARRHDLPLVLLCHDDYEDTVPASMRLQLRNIYRQAFARLCVSEPMASEFEKRYEVKGEVLYPIPSGSARAPLEQKVAQLRLGFAGRFGPGYEEAMVRLADAIGEAGGKLVVLSQTPRELFRRFWSRPAVVDCGQVAPDRIDAVLQQNEVNALAVVQSFDARDEQAFRLNFPSKLTEYTTLGLPLLIVAPPSTSAVRWARTHGEVAIISSDAPAELAAAVRRLAVAATRFELAQNLSNVAREFSPACLQSHFEGVLHSATAGSLSKGRNQLA